MTILLINTSKPDVLVALIKDGNIVGQESWTGDKTLGTKLLSVVDELLITNNLKLTELDRVAVHGGPGHYSALRTGITAATFLSYGAHIDLVQIEGEEMETLIAQAQDNQPVKAIVPKYEQA